MCTWPTPNITMLSLIVSLVQWKSSSVILLVCACSHLARTSGQALFWVLGIDLWQGHFWRRYIAFEIRACPLTRDKWEKAQTGRKWHELVCWASEHVYKVNTGVRWKFRQTYENHTRFTHRTSEICFAYFNHRYIWIHLKNCVISLFDMVTQRWKHCKWQEKTFQMIVESNSYKGLFVLHMSEFTFFFHFLIFHFWKLRKLLKLTI